MNPAAEHSTLRSPLVAQAASASVWVYPSYALFFLMLFVPTAYRPLKAGLLLVVLITIGAYVARRHGVLPVHPTIVRWTWLLTSVGLFFVLYGVVQGNPGALRVSTVYVLWPWLYLVFVAGASRESIIRGLLKVLVAAMIAIDLYSLHYILYELGRWPERFYLELELGQEIGLYTGFIEFTLFSVSSLLYLVPFAVAALLVWPGKRDSRREAAPLPASRGWLWVGLLPGILLVLLSGRRALMLCVALAPLVTVALQALLPAGQRTSLRKQAVRSVLSLAVLTAAAFWYLQHTYGFNLEALKLMFLGGFDFIYDPSAGLRADQFKALMAGWREAPLLGNGLGAAAEVVRSNEQPWSYELYYVSLLFQTGLVGTLFYASGIAWIYWKGLHLIRSGTHLGLYAIPVLVGTTCFLLASATNPYLGKYDYLWVVFLPVALINLYLRSDKKPPTPQPAPPDA